MKCRGIGYLHARNNSLTPFVHGYTYIARQFYCVYKYLCVYGVYMYIVLKLVTQMPYKPIKNQLNYVNYFRFIDKTIKYEKKEFFFFF